MPSLTSPSARAYSTATHDLLRGEGLLFGGQGATGLLGDTWSLTSTGWVARSTTGPAPRTSAAMAAVSEPRRCRNVWWQEQQRVRRYLGMGWRPLDAARHRCTAIGTLLRSDGIPPDPGADAALRWPSANGVQLNDTWTWDGMQWTQLSPATRPLLGPSVSMSTELATARCLLVGTSFNGQHQVWAHDGIDWLPILVAPMPWQPCVFGAGLNTLVCGLNESFVVAMVVAGLTSQPGRVAPLGAGCGTPTATLQVRSRPRPGVTTGLELVANPSRAVLFALDLSSAGTALGGGCTLWLGASFVSALQISTATGFAEQLLPMPANPALRGLDLFAQAAVLEPVSSNGLVLTQGLRLTLGD